MLEDLLAETVRPRRGYRVEFLCGGAATTATTSPRGRREVYDIKTYGFIAELRGPRGSAWILFMLMSRSRGREAYPLFRAFEGKAARSTRSCPSPAAAAASWGPGC